MNPVEWLIFAAAREYLQTRARWGRGDPATLCAAYVVCIAMDAT